MTALELPSPRPLVRADSSLSGRSEEILKVQVVAVRLRKLDEVTLGRRHEREAAVRDVPEGGSVRSRLSSARESQESFAVNKERNMPPHTSSCRITLVPSLAFSRERVEMRSSLRRRVRPLQRHRGGNPVKAAQSALFWVKREVDGV